MASFYTKNFIAHKKKITTSALTALSVISALLEKAEEKMKTSDTKSEKQKEIVNVKVAMGWTVGEIF